MARLINKKQNLNKHPLVDKVIQENPTIVLTKNIKHVTGLNLGRYYIKLNSCPEVKRTEPIHLNEKSDKNGVYLGGRADTIYCYNTLNNGYQDFCLGSGESDYKVYHSNYDFLKCLQTVLDIMITAGYNGDDGHFYWTHWQEALIKLNKKKKEEEKNGRRLRNKNIRTPRTKSRTRTITRRRVQTRRRTDTRNLRRRRVGLHI